MDLITGTNRMLISFYHWRNWWQAQLSCIPCRFHCWSSCSTEFHVFRWQPAQSLLLLKPRSIPAASPGLCNCDHTRHKPRPYVWPPSLWVHLWLASGSCAPTASWLQPLAFTAMCILVASPYSCTSAHGQLRSPGLLVDPDTALTPVTIMHHLTLHYACSCTPVHCQPNSYHQPPLPCTHLGWAPTAEEVHSDSQGLHSCLWTWI